MRVKRGPIAYRSPVELPPCRQCGVALNPETVELTCEGAFCRVCSARDPVGGMLGRPGPQAGSRAAGASEFASKQSAENARSFSPFSAASDDDGGKAAGDGE